MIEGKAHLRWISSAEISAVADEPVTGCCGINTNFTCWEYEALDPRGDFNAFISLNGDRSVSERAVAPIFYKS